MLQYDTSFNVITRPANDFVCELIGADDMMRLLRLVTVRNVLEPLQPAHGAMCGTRRCRIDDSMRDALARLAACQSTTRLPVADGDGQLVGQCNLAAVRERLRGQPACSS